MKVSELSGALLDLWVAKAESVDAILSDPRPNGTVGCITYYSRDDNGRMDGRSYSPSQHWSDGGPIIERNHITTVYYGTDGMTGAPWEAHVGSDIHYIDQRPGDEIGGPTALVAAMRAYVARKYGSEVAE